jgi:hypothetical protein
LDLPKNKPKNAPEMPTTPDLLAGLGIADFTPFRPSVGIANSPVQSVGTRREWRIKQSTGELRGICVRQKNKARKSVGWFDKRSPGWGGIVEQYEAWRRKPRYPVGTFEQSIRDDAGQPTSEGNRDLHH